VVSRYVDRATDGPPVGRCVVLPGRQYSPDGPLLFFAAQVALHHGWDVRQVWWDAAERGSVSVADEVAWVGDELDAALGGHDGPALVIGKSLGTLGARRAAERGLDAVWLTPLLNEPSVAEVLLAHPAEQLVVIGEHDPYLDREVLDALPGEHLLVPGDHVLSVPGRPVESVRSHERVVRALDAWLARLGT